MNNIGLGGMLLLYWGVVLGVIVAMLNAVWRVSQPPARAVQANELFALPLFTYRRTCP